MSANSRAIQYTLAATIMSTGASAMAENIANLKATGKERVAALIPQTGPLAPVGKDIRHGTSLALEYLKNEKGITLEISFLDSGNTPDDAKKVTNQAILDGTTLFINCFGGVACMEIAKNSKSFPLINPMTGAMLLRDSEKFPNVYPLVNGAR